MVGGDSEGVWDGHVLSMDNPQGPRGTLLTAMWQPGWEGSLGGEWIHVYECPSPFAVHLKLSLHC